MQGHPGPGRPNLAVAVTAVVFVAWFSAVKSLGAERTGLFNGLVPIASLIAVAVIGTGNVTVMQLAGALSVLAGVIVGLTQPASRYPATRALRHGRRRVDGSAGSGPRQRHRRAADAGCARRNRLRRTRAAGPGPGRVAGAVRLATAGWPAPRAGCGSRQC